MRKIEKVKGLTPAKLTILGQVLNSFERETKKDVNIHNVSGGYAYASVPSYDNEYINITLKHGIQSDCTDSTTVEDWKLKRSYLTTKRSIKKIVDQIEPC